MNLSTRLRDNPTTGREFWTFFTEREIPKSSARIRPYGGERKTLASRGHCPRNPQRVHPVSQFLIGSWCSQRNPENVEMPPSKTSCALCCKNKRKCNHNAANIQRKSDDNTIASQHDLVIRKGNLKPTPKCNRMLRSTPSTSNNRFGKNQHSMKCPKIQKEKN